MSINNFSRVNQRILLARNRGMKKFHSWFKRKNIQEKLQVAYKEKLLPLEEHHLFNEFHSPKMTDRDFDAKPMVMLMGQYSTGKTTLIRYLLQCDFPGMRIGPEPTTDKFIAIMHGEKSQIIPGNALVTHPEKPFGPLARFGNAFLTHFQCSVLANPLLEGLTLIDTPGILSGEKQRVDRGYDFCGVLEWLSERVDRIILLFDAHKLDISDEFKWAIESLKRCDDKILILLNKADMMDQQSLMRIYGSLMWSLQRVINTPEVPRVHVGSFWEKPLKSNINRQLFEDEENDLLRDLERLPSEAVLRKLNDLNKRARLAIVHAYIMDEIRRENSVFFRKRIRKDKTIENLSTLFYNLQKNLNISAGDFPDVKEMQEKLVDYDFSTFKTITPYLVRKAEEMLSEDIPKIMASMAEEESPQYNFRVAPVKTKAESCNNNPQAV